MRGGRRGRRPLQGGLCLQKEQRYIASGGCPQPPETGDACGALLSPTAEKVGKDAAQNPWFRGFLSAIGVLFHGLCAAVRRNCKISRRRMALRLPSRKRRALGSIARVVAPAVRYRGQCVGGRRGRRPLQGGFCLQKEQRYIASSGCPQPPDTDICDAMWGVGDVVLYFFALLSTTSRTSAAKASSVMAPRSPSERWRGETVSFSISRSPTTTM